jgi:catechol 2,3-dioxygenase-like lactoylglutathione lyase family enzyme
MADFHHFGVTVRDIERSYDFYTEVAGMTVWNQEAALDVEAPTSRETQRTERMEFMVFSSAEFDVITDNPGSKFKYVMLQSADCSVVFQLTEYVAQGGAPLEVGHNRPGSMHLSFFVDDVVAHRESVIARGWTADISPIAQITPSMRSYYVDDPDGVPVEFLQVQR